MKENARKPTIEVKTYLKYGFVITEHQFFYCPKCEYSLNASPNYQPNYCEECGQRVTFAGVEWKNDKVLGYLSREQRRETYESVKD